MEPSLERTPQVPIDIEEIAKQAEDQAEAEKIRKEYEEYLKACGSGVNTAIADTLAEIMEGRKK